MGKRKERNRKKKRQKKAKGMGTAPKTLSVNPLVEVDQLVSSILVEKTGGELKKEETKLRKEVKRKITILKEAKQSVSKHTLEGKEQERRIREALAKLKEQL
ncbi:hypothetical protein ADUPG1_005088, partial [Aduncisulcus paluster]